MGGHPRSNKFYFMLKTFVYSLLLVTLFTGCLKGSNDFQCTFDECAPKTPEAQIQAIKDYLSSNSLTATQHCSGLFYKIENEGSGAQPTACSSVFARYKGMFTSGAVFDESTTGVAFSLSEVITGWTIGLPKIKKGGRIILYVPPYLGYGSENYPRTGQVRIPGNSILVFEVDLLDVQ